MTSLIGVALLALTGVFGPPRLDTQPGAEPPADAILDMLVWGSSATNDRAFAEPLRTEVRDYQQRANSYRSMRVVPDGGTDRLVNLARIRYERRLVALTGDPAARMLAVEYVDELGPCYEWEGMSDCPAREARFADAYQSEHPDGPFTEYLPLLAAHRWLCAAELFDFEKRISEKDDARRKYNARVARARQSKSLIVRTGAERLAVRATCLAAQ
jgi:hypothetical protein